MGALKKTWTLNESRWFDNKKKPCIKDFKEENLNSYDFADNWGTAQYERRVMCAWYETKFKTDKVINEKSPVWR